MDKVRYPQWARVILRGDTVLFERLVTGLDLEKKLKKRLDWYRLAILKLPVLYIKSIYDKKNYE